MFARIALIVVLATFLGWSVATRSVESAGPAQVYVVQPGDTLWSIASERYAGDPREGVWELRRRNHLLGTTISPGEKLVLP
jgi:LysM repeat protein